MVYDQLDPEVQTFLDSHITAPRDLDVLLALIEGDGRWWDAETMASHTGLPQAEARRSLEHLASRNLLAIKISDALRYQLQPGTAELDRDVRQFAASYRRSPAAVIRWAASRSRRTVAHFADAFRIKRR